MRGLVLALLVSACSSEGVDFMPNEYTDAGMPPDAREPCIVVYEWHIRPYYVTPSVPVSVYCPLCEKCRGSVSPRQYVDGVFLTCNAPGLEVATCMTECPEMDYLWPEPNPWPSRPPADWCCSGGPYSDCE
jgi:hypothetical protein